MEDILDALKRIVSRWVETSTPILSDVSPNDTVVNVGSTARFSSGDEVMIEDVEEGEPNLVIADILDDTHVELATPVYNAWTTSSNSVLRKLINGMFVEGIYIGEPEVIPMYPAITINGTSIDSEWFTLDSTKEDYKVELTIYVKEATQEDGYRFLLKMTDAIREGLKQNIYPLINDYETVALTSDALPGDSFVKVADSSIFNSNLTNTDVGYPRLSETRVFLEDSWKSQEMRCKRIIDANTIEVAPAVCHTFRVQDNAIAIQPKRFIFNSWPKSIQFGKTKKQDLLQAATISWFAWEEDVRNFRNMNPHLK